MQLRQRREAGRRLLLLEGRTQGAVPVREGKQERAGHAVRGEWRHQEGDSQERKVARRGDLHHPGGRDQERALGQRAESLDWRITPGKSDLKIEDKLTKSLLMQSNT